MPLEIPVSYQEIAHCLDKSISRIESAIQAVLEETPAELYKDITNNCIYLAGGGSQIRGLDKRLTDKFNLKFVVANEPLLAVAKGTNTVLKNLNRFQSILMR